MSKIEPGCLAMVRTNTNGDNGGKLLRVLDKKDCLPGEWRIQTLERFHSYCLGRLVGSCPPGSIIFGLEYELRRIDNPGDDEADLLLAPLPQQDKVPA